jgi:hypothetical protein
MCLYVLIQCVPYLFLNSVLWCPLLFPHIRLFGSPLPPAVNRSDHVLSILCVSLGCPFVIAQSCQCFWVVHSWLPNVASVSGLSIRDCPMLPVSLGCPFVISQCCQCLWVVHSWLSNVARVSKDTGPSANAAVQLQAKMRDLERRGVSQSVNIYTIDITGLIRMSYKRQELITFESIWVHPRCLVLPVPDLPLCLV